MSTLFFDTQIVVDGLLYSYSLLASKEFFDCADKQLTSQFIAQTGLKPGKNVCFSLSSHFIGAPIYSEYILPNSNLAGRKLCINLYINHNWNPVTIYWRSKKGIDYKLHETNIDCTDIEFWFEKLDTDLYIKQLYPTQKLPFKTGNLPFQLEVLRLNMDATLTLTIKEGCAKDPSGIISGIGDYINKFNTASERKDRKFGVVHNFKASSEGLALVIDLDLGSAGMFFLKGILNHLATVDCLEKVELG